MQLRSFMNSRIIEGCIISENESDLLPYIPFKISKVYIRKCYQDIFNLFLDKISNGNEYFAISGTPGIGKSLFFVYILYRLTHNTTWKPKHIVYQKDHKFYLYDMKNYMIYKGEAISDSDILESNETLYVIDGRISTPTSAKCVTLFISSPRSDYYKSFVKQNMATEWYLPVWSEDELERCHKTCYLNIEKKDILRRYHIFGGVARYVFNSQENIIKKMDSILEDANAVKGVRSSGVPTDIYADSHTLLHITVDESNYEYKCVDVASMYVAEQLLIRHAEQMIENMRDLFGGSPSQISSHLFEIYGHLIFKRGNIKLKCKCLEDNNDQDYLHINSNDGYHSFSKENIPSKILKGNYYEASDDANFPVIDSLTSQGMFQFTVSQTHPIRGVTLLKQICNLYDIPKLYFVVPGNKNNSNDDNKYSKFNNFKKQKFKKGDKEVNMIPELKQYVLELPLANLLLLNK